eukprot:CAMPEP_0179088066 /NCGR_PEP_ID=MMETSP0796-20121207/40047_1 /TAXON_ID=73915 /ORGANISM="Pyrodinium bahamense, Strain pbaha01" /LENGTH=362 /DNA_ID=CAMNT_0020785583 /DNA_START=58 /DNA_END=1146 /DNA_ORIENTATION=+
MEFEDREEEYEQAAEALRRLRLEGGPKADEILGADMDQGNAVAICMQAGGEPGGEEMDGSHDVDVAVVYNALKRVLNFSDLVRKNKGGKSVLETSIQRVAKQAFDILVGKHGAGGGAVPDILKRLEALKIQRVGLVGNRLGLAKARELYEHVIGELEDHVEYLSHEEPPAPIDVAELGVRGLPSDNSLEPEPDHDSAEVAQSVAHACAVVVLHFSQSKSWLPAALLEGPELQNERDAPVASGFSPKLPSGAKIFVPAEVYLPVVRHLEAQGLRLRTSHVVVAVDLEEKLMGVVEAARQAASKRERGTCKVKERVELKTSDAASSKMPPAADVAFRFEVKRTLIHVPIPNSMHSSLSIHPSTV